MSHRVTLAPGDERFVAREDEPVLEAALRHGLNLPHSCRGGSCLSCKATLRAGEVAYPRGLPGALDPDEAAAGAVLLCLAQARSDLVVEARTLEIPANVRIRRLPCRVQRLERLAEDVMAMFLKLPGFEPFEYLPGQYVDILLEDGRRRSFSIACPPHDSGLLELHVRRVEGGYFTGRVFGGMAERTLLRLEGPLGQFYLREESGRPILMVCGGTGFAPLKAMIRHAFHHELGRPIHLYWGARNREGLYERELVKAWAREREGFRFTPVLSEPAPADQWAGRGGWVHEAVLEDHPDLSRCEVYAAGPPEMVEALRSDFPRQGMDPAYLYFDSFDYAGEEGDAP